MTGDVGISYVCDIEYDLIRNVRQAQVDSIGVQNHVQNNNTNDKHICVAL